MDPKAFFDRFMDMKIGQFLKKKLGSALIEKNKRN
jgi:hypothetical protein